jgi:hypothetical protein
MPRLQEEMDRISAAFEEGQEQGKRQEAERCALLVHGYAGLMESDRRELFGQIVDDVGAHDRERERLREEGREQGRQERQTDIVEWLHRIDGGCDVIVYVAGIAKAIEVRDWKKSNDGAS